MISAADRVAREDLVMFINACFACTGQREFYADARGQAVSIDFLHAYILGNYRLLYARALAAGINHYNQAEVIVRLLATGRDTPAAHREEEGRLVAAALAALPVHRAWHVLEALKERRVNNRRARAVVREHLASRRDLPFEAVKYRRSMRAAVRHAHLRLGRESEISAFLFRGFREPRYATHLFEAFRRAHFSERAIYELPYSIAEGLARKHRVPREIFLERIAPRLTAAERLRLQGASERALGARYAIDLAAAGPTRLASYALSLPAAERRARADELRAALSASAARAARRTGARFGRVAAVLDRSYSSYGSSEKRRRPLAVALAASAFFRASAREYRAFWAGPVDDELLVEARGATDLATPILDALEWGLGRRAPSGDPEPPMSNWALGGRAPSGDPEPPMSICGADLVVIVSDGYDNDPPRGAAEVLRVYRSRLWRPGGPFLVHLNPVFDADGYAPKSLSPGVPTVGVRDAEDIPTMIGFSRFAAGESTRAELEAYLARRVERLLDHHARRIERRTAGDLSAETEADAETSS